MDTLVILAMVLALAALGVALYVMFRAVPATSFIDLAEFKKLHPDLRAMWTTNVTDGIMPEIIGMLNTEYDKLSDNDKETMKTALKAAVDEARRQAAVAKNTMIYQVTQAPVAIAATMAPTRPARTRPPATPRPTSRPTPRPTARVTAMP